MRNSSHKGIIFTVLTGLAIILSLNFWQNPVKGFFYNSTAGLQQALWGAGQSAGGFFSGFFNSGLQKENEQLRLANAGLLAANAALKEVQAENVFLRETLGLGLNKTFRLAVADVLSQPSGQDTILINQGARDGLSRDMPVVTKEKVLLGRISEVYDKQSRVLLITGDKSSLDAKVQDSEISGVIRGKGSGQLAFDLVPKNQDLKEGSLIVTTALGGIYPKGLLVGTIRRAQKNDTEPFWQTEVSPLLKASGLSQVLIIVDF
jgi:rod shape-determining protein MreC